MNYTVTFGALDKDGKLSDVRQVDTRECPFVIFDPSHYRENGSCKCSNAEHRKKMIKEWKYKKSQFKNIPLVD